MHTHDCRSCQTLQDLFQRAAAACVRAAIEARDLGPDWGVFLCDPEDLVPEEPDRLEGLRAALLVGYYVAPVTIAALDRLGRNRGERAAPDVVALDRLNMAPPEGSVHMLGAVRDCIATVLVEADPQRLPELDREAALDQRLDELLRLAQPLIQRTLREDPRALTEDQPPDMLFIVLAPSDPRIDRFVMNCPERSAEERDRLVAEARELGVYVDLQPRVTVLAKLPLEEFRPSDTTRLLERVYQAVPPNAGHVVTVHERRLEVTVVERVA